MKTFLEVIQDIDQLNIRNKMIKEELNEITAKGRAIDDIKKRMAYSAEVAEIQSRRSQEICDNKIAIAILTSNARIVLFNEVMPTVLEVLSKYAGKPYGEKTKEKIRNEILERTKCYFYISNDNYHVSPQNYNGDYDLECATKYIDNIRLPILIDNKIQAVNIDDLQLYYSNKYIENVDERVDQLKEAYQDALVKQSELEEACKKYNSLTVGNMKYISLYDKIYNSIF